VFLLSTGRTGTRFLAGFFAEYGMDVAAHHTTRGTRVLNILNNLALLGLLPMSAADAWLARASIPGIMAEPRRWVECNPYYFNSIPALRRAFPQARFIFVTRHPRAFCESHIRWEHERMVSRIANQLVPFWGPVGYQEQLLGLLGNYRQRVRYYAKVWARRNAVILGHLADDADAIRLRFEDIFDAPDGLARLTTLLRELDIAPSRPIDADAVRTRVNQTDRTAAMFWDAHCDALVLRHCGAVMGRLGYALDA